MPGQRQRPEYETRRKNTQASGTDCTGHGCWFGCVFHVHADECVCQNAERQSLGHRDRFLSKSDCELAFFVSCLGLFGLALFSTEQRKKEIGIRKVNGASISQTVMLLSYDFTKLVIISFIIACPISYYAVSKWLENFAYKTELSWWIFALAGISVTSIAIITVSWQSWQAASKNPVEALRYE